MPSGNLTAQQLPTALPATQNRALGRVLSATGCALLLAAAAFCAGGCATPGEPTPRQPILPVAVTDLAAHQQGDAVILTFTLPTSSTEHEPLGQLPAVEIYRGMLAPDETAHKTPTRLIYTIPRRL